MVSKSCRHITIFIICYTNCNETYDNYHDAVSYIHNQSFVGPCYIIIGGVNENEGGVITVGPNHTLYDCWDIPNALPNETAIGIDTWYVLETNYDHWHQPPWFDLESYINTVTKLIVSHGNQLLH